jgi:two-component system response regulator ResD
VPAERSVVLVVEDDQIVRTLLCELIARAGYTAETAEDGPSGLARIAAGGVDLVLLDMMLPGMDGLEVCRQVRAQETGGYLPILLLTALVNDELRRDGFAAGADDYITKPFDPDDVHDRVQVWVAMSQRLRAAQQGSRAPEGPEADPLATLVRLVHRLGGEIALEPAPDGGATCRISVPLASAEQTALLERLLSARSPA